MTSHDSNINPKTPKSKNEAIRNIKVNSKFFEFIGYKKCFEEADGEFRLTEIDEHGNAVYHKLINNSHLGVFLCTINALEDKNPKNKY